MLAESSLAGLYHKYNIKNNQATHVSSYLFSILRTVIADADVQQPTIKSVISHGRAFLVADHLIYIYIYIYIPQDCECH